MNRADDLLHKLGEVIDTFRKEGLSELIPNGPHDAGTVVQTDEISNQAIGKRLRSARGERSRKVFAAELGISPTTLFRYEKGDRSIDADVIANVCKTFGIDPRWLLLGDGTPPMSTQRQGEHQ